MNTSTPELSIHLITSISASDPAAWDSFAPDTPYASHRWAAFCETVTGADQPVIFTASQAGETLGRAQFWLTRQTPLPIPNTVVRSGMHALLRRWPLLICHTPLVNRGGLALAEPPQTDSALRTAALEAITARALEFGREQRMFAALYDYLGPDDPAPASFTRMEMPEPGTFCAIEWSDFEEYLAGLGKSARKDYRRHANRAADLGITVRVLEQVPAPEEALRLIRAVEAQHNTAPNPYAPAILAHLGQVDGRWLAAESDGRLVGCGALLPDRGALTLALLGLDYTVQYAYFQLMYAALRYAIESGARVLRGGSGAYEFKGRLGFQQEPPSAVAFYLRQGGLRWLANRM